MSRLILSFFPRHSLFKPEMRRKLFILFALALLTGVAGCEEPQQIPAPVLNFGIHSDSPAGAVIIVERESLWNIAKRYRLPMRDIIDANNLEPPYTIAPGQRLKLPAPVDYRTRGGDTLYSVANMFGVSVSQLAKVNGLQEPYAFRLGQVLRIPSSIAAGKPDAVASVPLPPPVSRSILSPPLVSPRKTEVIHQPAVTTLSQSQLPGFMWPLHGKIISGYGPKEGGLYNDGINIAAPRGTPVASAAAGIVAYVGNDLKSYGNLVLIRHGGGMTTAYAHLSSVNIKKGMAVRKGQAIGSVGSTGSVASTQLHFEIRHGSKTFDPKRYLG